MENKVKHNISLADVKFSGGDKVVVKKTGEKLEIKSAMFFPYTGVTEYKTTDKRFFKPSEIKLA